MRPKNRNDIIISHEAKVIKAAKYLGEYCYWDKCVRRLSVFSGVELGPGLLIDGQLDPYTRSHVGNVYRKFMDAYSDKVGEHRPFLPAQEAEIERCLSGGLLT